MEPEKEKRGTRGDQEAISFLRNDSLLAIKMIMEEIEKMENRYGPGISKLRIVTSTKETVVWREGATGPGGEGKDWWKVELEEYHPFHVVLQAKTTYLLHKHHPERDIFFSSSEAKLKFRGRGRGF